MKKITLFIVAGLFGLYSFTATAQQDPQFSHYMFNGLFFNPAYAGMDGAMAKFSFLHRTQWLGYEAAGNDGALPQSNLLSFHAPLLKYQSGVGVVLMQDRIGPIYNYNARASYAYHFMVGEGKLSLGLSGGVYAITMDFDQYRAINPDDPLIRKGSETDYKPDMAAGVWYESPKYYGGISMNHVIQSEFDFGIDGARNPLARHMYVTGGYHWEATYDLVVTPSVLVKTEFETYSYDLNVMGTYKERFYGGLSYRQSDAITALVGVHALKDKSLTIGYSFDYTVPATEAKELTSHELYLSYQLPVIMKGSKPVIRTPRYSK